MRRIPTKAELQKQNQKRKEALIKKAQEKGIVELTARYLSAIYLLHSHSAILYADLEEILQENGLAFEQALRIYRADPHERRPIQKGRARAWLK
ncbi:MAG: hypothetical protein ACOYIG_08540 [Acetivibrionales bacterium]|jgi:hypothetical protein